MNDKGAAVTRLVTFIVGYSVLVGVTPIILWRLLEAALAT